MKDRILILDYGSQFTQLIARGIREIGVYSEIHLPGGPEGGIAAWAPSGVVLSGGPASVYESGSAGLRIEALPPKVPALGICYGMQLLAQAQGGRVEAGRREYGPAQLKVRRPAGLFQGFSEGEETRVWCSHGDHVDRLPRGFRRTASTADLPVAAFESADGLIHGVQFHPEVAHTQRGGEILRNFVLDICGCEPSWTPENFAAEAVKGIRRQVGSGEAICGLSGGVDSTVAAMLVHQAVGDRLTCVFVDNGLLREGEAREVEEAVRGRTSLRLVVVDAGARFLSRLKGVSDPEEKRRRIGETFVRVFEEAARTHAPGARFLVQGTLYPDVIESVSVRGPSAAIKTHHNVGGLPDDLGFELVEPLRMLFKDEVRALGRELGADVKLLGRHPFPGPGLAVRILGEVREERLRTLRTADAIFLEEIRAHGLYDEIWQAFAVLLPVRAVGVMGDDRTYENAAVLRAVLSRDGMTADWYPFEAGFLERVSARIINETPGVNRVAYDISSKPPATIEWE